MRYLVPGVLVLVAGLFAFTVLLVPVGLAFVLADREEHPVIAGVSTVLGGAAYLTYIT